MKHNAKGIWKIFAFLYLIPTGVLLLLTALDAIFRYAYYEIYAFPEWLVPIPDAAARLILLFATYLLFGVCGYFIFFYHGWMRLIVPVFSLLWAPLMPMLMYGVRHIAYGSTTDASEMMVMFHSDVSNAVLVFFYVLMIGIVLGMELLLYSLLLHEKPQNEVSVFSPRNPVGFGFLLYFIAMIVLALVQFFVAGNFAGENILSIIMELLINAAGFFVACFAASKIPGILAGKKKEKAES